MRIVRASAVLALTGALFLPAAIPAGAQADLQARVDRLEALVRDLNGQVEVLAYQVQQLQALVQGFAGGANMAALPPQTPAAVPTVPLNLAPVVGAPPAVLGEVPLDAAPQPLPPPTNTAQAAGAPLDLGAVLRGDQPAAAAPVTTGNARADYERAYMSLLNGDYAIAEAAFRAFLAAYPGDPLAIDAQYWLGESLFTRGMHVDAANAFLATYNANPQGPKAADALLKLGISLVQLGQLVDGCTTFARILSQYPNASNALRQRVTSEQTLARCV